MLLVTRHRISAWCYLAQMKRSTNAMAPTPPPTKRTKSKPLLMPSVDASGPLSGKAAQIAAQLRALYPNPPIPLSHSSSFQLLVAVMLSAQSTDVKVNQVTPELFRNWPTAAAMATAQVADIENVIRALGLAPTKAKNLSATSKALIEQHGGEVPDSFEALESLPGIGHKTASVVMSQAFNHVAFPVDTHIHRLAQRWGLSNGHSVEQTEADLKALLPESSWRDVHLQIIYYGREHCPAVGHDPTGCLICSWAAVPPYNKAGSSPARPGQKPPSLKKFTPTKMAPTQQTPTKYTKQKVSTQEDAQQPACTRQAPHHQDLHNQQPNSQGPPLTLAPSSQQLDLIQGETEGQGHGEPLVKARLASESEKPKSTTNKPSQQGRARKQQGYAPGMAEQGNQKVARKRTRGGRGEVAAS